LLEEKRQRNWLPLAIVVVLLAVAGAGVWHFLLRGGAQAPQERPPTAEATAYIGKLGLANVEMKAKDSMMGGTLVEITGEITNKGARTLRQVELNCVFTDPYGQPLKRERVAIVRPRAGAGLKPGETRRFRLPFDSIPDGWNQALPQLVIAGIDFE
jgi:hypothetical protein